MRRRNALPAHVYRHQRHRPVGLFAAVVAAMVVVGGAAYYLAARRPAARTPAAASSRPAPPRLVGIVTEIGSGAAIGTGSKVEVLDLTHPAAPASRTVAVGAFPDAVAIAPGGKTAYVTDYSANTVTPVDLETGLAGRPIAAGDGPAGIAIAPDGKTAYVTDAGSTPLGDTVTPIDLKTARPKPAIRVGLGPQGIAITPNGQMAYVTDAGAVVKGQNGAIGHTVTPIDLKAGKALPPIAVGNAPLSIAISSDGSTAFVTNTYSGSVSPISLAANAAGTPIEVRGAPEAIVAVPRRAEMVVADTASAADNLTVISVGSERITGSFSSPKAPTALAAAPDGKTVWVVSSGENALVPVSLPSGTIEAASAISVPGGPFALGLGEVPGADAKTLFASPRPTTRKPATKKNAPKRA